MIKLILSIFSLLAVGCVPPKISLLDSSVKNPEFQPYVDYFYQMSTSQSFNADKFANVKLGFDYNHNNRYFDNNNSTLGICVIDSQNAVIAINPRYWNDPSFDEYDKKTLFLHELSHCLLLRDHSWEESDVTNGLVKENGNPMYLPDSLMFPYHVYAYYKTFSKNRFINDYLPNHYVPELFSLEGKPTFSFGESNFDEKYERFKTFVINENGCDHEEVNPNESIISD